MQTGLSGLPIRPLMIKNLKELHKIEFWAASLIYGYVILNLISNGSYAYTMRPGEFEAANIPFSYTGNYFIPGLFKYSILYFSFLALNFCILPPLYQKKNTGVYLLLLLVVFLLSGLVISIAETYSKAYLLVKYDSMDTAYDQIFFSGFTYAVWLVSLIAIYVALKKLTLYLLENYGNDQRARMKLEMVFGAGIWFTGVLVWLAAGVDTNIILCWTLVLAASISLVIYSLYYLIPKSLEQNRPFRYYYWSALLIAFVSCFPLAMTGALISGQHDLFPIVLIFNLAAQSMISAPLSWYIFKKRNETEAQIFWLKKELGKSDASLGFLKSQINPHFLFNALNTLYGTALQEDAARTSEGIQKLGDMMRFMLQENLQDKISLSRDVEYLHNYIELQKLRTSLSGQILISTEIEDNFNALQIAPMLLIPFVENAFKHGISLQNPSHIKITLQTRGEMLYFDVHNSMHPKREGDPEQRQGGIGLPNVKQRLQLLYPAKHELIIRESAKEFFVHLTLNLS